MKNYLLILSFISIGFSGCSTKDDYLLFNKAELNQPTNTGSTQNQESTVSNVTFDYKIQPHDRISVTVYKHPELSTSNINRQTERGILVNTKGELRMPLIKRVQIAGLTQTEAENKLSQALSTYIKSPDVQLEVMNQRAYVIGEVKNPGEIPLDNERLTLLQAIAKSGDFTDSANRKSILIFRGGDTSKVHTSVVNLTDVHSLKTANLMIKPNDIVYVMPNGMKAFNVGVNEVSPIFRLIGNILQPFVSIKFLSN
jgi:polysaccharide export outer membrane protein